MRQGQEPPSPDRRTQLQRLRDRGIQPPMPRLLAGNRLIGWLMDAGPVAATGNGMTGLSHTEIAAWKANTGTVLTAWEVRTLRHLSQAYAGEAMDSSQRAAPYQAETPVDMTEAKRQTADTLRAEIRAMAA